MGLNFFDNFSYLHFASGVIANFWNVSFTQLVIFHTIFEILENTPMGVKFIQKTFGTFWTGGGKLYPDSFINSVGDTVFVILGWLSAYYLNELNKKYLWYDKNPKR